MGTIGAAEFLEQPPHSYDEYKDEDVGLDPFYHDVPKIKKARSKREALKNTDIIRNEEDAISVLRFLFDWYKNNEKSATESTTVPTVISTRKTPEAGNSTKINKTSMSRENEENNYKNSELFNTNSKFNIIGHGNENRNIQERRSTDTITKQQTKMSTTKATTTTEVSKYEKDFLDELFGPEGDYVNDNFEPIAYNQKYEESGKDHNKTTAVVLLEEVKNHTLSKDYVDDNMEPVHFKGRVETNIDVEKKVLVKTQSNEKTEETDISLNSNTHLNSNDLKPTKESKETLVIKTQSSPKVKPSSEVKEAPSGDTETNDIKQNVQKESKSDISQKTSGFSEPKSEILEPVTTERTTPSVKPKSRRGRKRFHNTTEREKESESKNVVLEKITERAHTAKDDFNYLRTLYKVHTTTPASNVFEPKSLEETGTAKVQRIVNDYIDVKEASPSDKIVRTLEKNRAHETFSEPLDLIPIITTESTTTTTSERTLPLSTITTEMIPTSPIIASSTTTVEGFIPVSIVIESTVSASTTATEQIKPPSTTTNEKAILSKSKEVTSSTTSQKTTTSSTSITEHVTESSVTDEMTISSSTITTEMNISPSVTTIENIMPSSTTTTKNTPSITVARETTMPPSITSTERIIISSATSETSILSNTDATQANISLRRDSGRRGRMKYADSSQSGSSERLHEENDTSRSRSEKIISNIISATTNVSSTTEESNTVQKNSDHKDLVEENGYTSTAPNNPLSGSTEQTEFLTQLTLNYKKMFEDMIQTSEPIAPPVLDASTLAVTEADGSNTSISAKSIGEHKKGKEKMLGGLIEQSNVNHADSLVPTTSYPNIVNTVEETTTKSETMMPFTQLKSESQVLQSEETTTVGKSVRGMESSNTETSKYLEIVPTTIISTEKLIKNEAIQETSTQTPNKLSNSTERVTDEAKPTEITISTTSTAENVTNLENTVQETEGAKFNSVPDGIGNDPTPGLKTPNLSQEETYQTTPNPIKVSTSFIPGITEIFNIFSISKEEEILGTPTEHTIKSADVISTQKSREKIIIDTNTVVPKSSSAETDQNLKKGTTLGMRTFNQKNLPLDKYPSAVFVVRKTENAQTDREENLREEIKLKVQLTEENVDETETYPSTFLMIRTTENPTVSKYQAEEKSSSTPQLLPQNLLKFIEESTKSVAAPTNIPTITDPKNTDFYEDVKNVIATTESGQDLEELTSLFQYPASSSYLTSTPVNTLLSPQEEAIESSTVSSITEEPTTHSIIITDPEQMSTSQIERLSISERPLRTTSATITTTAANRRGSNRRGGRPTGRRNLESRRGAAKHRFSTESFTRRPEGRRQTIEDEILSELTKSSSSATTESYRRRLRVRPNSNRIRDSSTDAPLQKSASPTQPEKAKESLPTTPISKEGNGKFFLFNCFGKEVDKFYPDPRDCRLFHYCTQGYNKNQLIDMKFVCDSNTYFDDVKLTCSKRKPRRCL